MFNMVGYTSGQFQGWVGAAGSGKIDRIDYVIYLAFIR